MEQKDISSIKQKLMLDARLMYPSISPLKGKKSFHECFSVFNKELVFWFNTADKSTHILKAKCSEE